MKKLYIVAFFSFFLILLGVSAYFSTPEYVKEMFDVFTMRTYEVDVWDCSNMSMELRDRLIDKGYDAYICSGFMEEDYEKAVNSGKKWYELAHVWVKVRLNDSFVVLDTPWLGVIGNEKEYENNYHEIGCCNHGLSWGRDGNNFWWICRGEMW